MPSTVTCTVINCLLYSTSILCQCVSQNMYADVLVTTVTENVSTLDDDFCAVEWSSVIFLYVNDEKRHILPQFNISNAICVVMQL